MLHIMSQVFVFLISRLQFYPFLNIDIYIRFSFSANQSNRLQHSHLFIYLFIYLAVLGLSCGMWDL